MSSGLRMPVRRDFGGVGMFADFKFQIRQGFLDRALQIFTDVGFVEADVVGFAERAGSEKGAADTVDDIVDEN